ncbi:MAG TPA: S41 family peptidase, partial [Bryobacteraceae bacterium]
SVLTEFRDYLNQQKIAFTDADWNENKTWLTQQLKREMYATGFSFEESQKVAIETDPMVAKAVDAIPQAKNLLDSSKKLIVQRLSQDDRR